MGAFFDAMRNRVGDKILQRLAASEVAVVGLGGLGSNVACMLASSCVGHILLVDFDVVDITNLNRQRYFVSHINMPKTDACKLQLKEINPDINVSCQNIRITQNNASDILGKYKIVCECIDDPQYKAIIANELLTKTNTILVAASGMAGYGKSERIKTKKINDRFYICGDMESDVEKSFLTAPRVTLCAAHQANIIIDLIIGGKV